MKSRSIVNTAMVLTVGMLPLFYDQPAARAGAADRESYYYRQKSFVPVELSGRVKEVKHIPLNGVDAQKEHTVVIIDPDRSRRSRDYGYGRIIDLGDGEDVREISRGDRIMIWGNTRRINTTPVVLADSVQINDGKTIDISRDPAFRRGYIWGRPLRDSDIYEYENVDIDDGGKWYFDSYEYVGYPYRELPPGASAPWAHNEREFQQRRAERYHEDQRFREDQRLARHDDRYTERQSGEDRGSRSDRMSGRRGKTGEYIPKSDQQLKRDVESNLEWSPSVDPDKVNVSVRNGVVTLTGKVSHPEEIDDVVENAYEAGAKQVISKLKTEE
ncbi:MAG TPA: BON domain-containing protein [Nitrospira sp.]|nr:BON domain-containing protein [Nitrospira sp.]